MLPMSAGPTMRASVSAAKRWKRGHRGCKQQSQGLVFTKASPVCQTLDFGYLAWHLGPEGGDPVTSGFDVAIVRNDVIAELYTVITK